MIRKAPHHASRVRPERCPVALRRSDQRTVAALLFLALLPLPAWWHRASVAPQPSYALRIDVNAAPWPELVVLPGVGESLARAIVQERIRGGAYRDAEQLQRVPGIGAKRAAQLAPLLVFPAAPIPLAEGAPGAQN